MMCLNKFNFNSLYAEIQVNLWQTSTNVCWVGNELNLAENLKNTDVDIWTTRHHSMCGIHVDHFIPNCIHRKLHIISQYSSGSGQQGSAK